MFRSRIDLAERRLQHARRSLLGHQRTLHGAARDWLSSPTALALALGAGFVWGLRPECRDIDTSRGARVKKAAGIASRAMLTRLLAGLVTSGEAGQ